jgi:hypothetical protein
LSRITCTVREVDPTTRIWNDHLDSGLQAKRNCETLKSVHAFMKVVLATIEFSEKTTENGIILFNGMVKRPNILININTAYL